MDIFCEYLVKKKSFTDTLIRFLIALSCMFLCFIVLSVAVLFYRPLVTLAPLIIAGLIFGAVQLGRRYSIEYEYVFTNGVLDIDIIYARSRRKKLISVPCNRIEHMGPVREIKVSSNNVVDAIYDMKRGGKYLISFLGDSGKTDLYFQPPEKLVLNMKKYNPKNINI